MKILIGGGSGFIGQPLSDFFEGLGHSVHIISRHKHPNTITWKEIREEGLPPCDLCINLAGAPLLAKRWSRAYKEALRKSRIETTRLLARAIARSPHPPNLFISSSAIGYYPSDLIEPARESSPPGRNFLSQLTVDWEAAAHLPPTSTTRWAIIRIGIVLGKKGGMLQKMLPAFRLGLGGPIGTGEQPISWIHINDLIRLFHFIVEEPRCHGIFNGTSPHWVTQRTFATTLAHHLHRPALLPFPAFLCRLGGERASLLLEGRAVFPERALEMGFTFEHPYLSETLTDLLDS